MLFDTKAPATFTPRPQHAEPSLNPDMTSFGRRRSLLGHPVPAEEFRPPHGRPTDPDGPDLDGVTAFRTHELRSDWAPPLPRGQRCSSWPESLPGQRPPLHNDKSLHPATTVHQHGAPLYETSIRGSHKFARPIFPSPGPPPVNQSNPSAFPRASHPADQEPNDARQGGDRPSSTDLELLAQHHIRVDPPVR